VKTWVGVFVYIVTCSKIAIRDKVGMMHLYYMAGLSDRLRDYVGNNDNSFHNGYEKMLTNY